MTVKWGGFVRISTNDGGLTVESVLDSSYTANTERQQYKNKRNEKDMEV